MKLPRKDQMKVKFVHRNHKTGIFHWGPSAKHWFHCFNYFRQNKKCKDFEWRTYKDCSFIELWLSVQIKINNNDEILSRESSFAKFNGFFACWLAINIYYSLLIIIGNIITKLDDQFINLIFCSQSPDKPRTIFMKSLRILQSFRHPNMALNLGYFWECGWTNYSVFCTYLLQPKVKKLTGFFFWNCTF